jgi:hypothetical protein
MSARAELRRVEIELASSAIRAVGLGLRAVLRRP